MWRGTSLGALQVLRNGARNSSARASGALTVPPPERPGWRPIRKIMAANRGEIAIRIFRAATEMNIKTVAIYSKEDFGSLHRYKADESFLVGADKSPVAAYLSPDEIVEVAKQRTPRAVAAEAEPRAPQLDPSLSPPPSPHPPPPAAGRTRMLSGA